jgi:threonine aldolase
MLFDLRSDTVTRPTEAMRLAMARADVGDDVYGEDPSVRALEERVAEITGKEAALFVPSGTQGNQIALLCHTQRADEVIVGEGAHCAFYESGAAGALAGVQLVVAGQGGLFTAPEALECIKPPEEYHPRTRLVALENTHNRAGGRVFPESDVLAIAALARAHGLGLHLDGARLWNASAKTGLPEARLAAPFDTVSVCFSKGLGAPVGSALCATRDQVRAARRFRKMLGGGMRQSGILAAGALHALTHHRERLVFDHEAAARIAARVAEVPGTRVIPVETNIVLFDTPGVPAARVVAAAKRRGVLVSAFGPERVRVVTHLDLAQANVDRAASALVDAAREATS